MSNHTNPVTITEHDLPLSCPSANTPVWNLHPKVFLDFDHQGNTKCPYCGAEYHIDPHLLHAH